MHCIDAPCRCHNPVSPCPPSGEPQVVPSRVFSVGNLLCDQQWMPSTSSMAMSLWQWLANTVHNDSDSTVAMKSHCGGNRPDFRRVAGLRMRSICNIISLLDVGLKPEGMDISAEQTATTRLTQRLNALKVDTQGTASGQQERHNNSYHDFLDYCWQKNEGRTSVCQLPMPTDPDFYMLTINPSWINSECSRRRSSCCCSMQSSIHTWKLMPCGKIPHYQLPLFS